MHTAQEGEEGLPWCVLHIRMHRKCPASMLVVCVVTPPCKCASQGVSPPWSSSCVQRFRFQASFRGKNFSAEGGPSAASARITLDTRLRLRMQSIVELLPLPSLLLAPAGLLIKLAAAEIRLGRREVAQRRTTRGRHGVRRGAPNVSRYMRVSSLPSAVARSPGHQAPVCPTVACPCGVVEPSRRCEQLQHII